jgi:hypothetical protein
MSRPSTDRVFLALGVKSSTNLGASTYTNCPESSLGISRTRALPVPAMPMLTINETAAELRVSRRWLEYWLAANPVDTAGVPFYVPLGRSKKFASTDIERMLAYMRDLEAARLGPNVKGKARLVGLMSQIGGVTYEDRLRRREEEKRKKDAEKAMRPKRRVRFPRRPKEEG